MRGLFFTGTDTDCGKTYVTAAVAQHLRESGRVVRVSKPVVTGSAWVGDDTRRLAEAAGETDFLAVTPWTFPEPAAPPVAARAAGVHLSFEEIAGAVRARAIEDGMLLVEGVGGLLCPLTEDATVADLVRELGLPLLVVARRGLGTLNHTLLTVEAARHRELRVAGVVVSETEQPHGLAARTNVTELRRLGIPILAVVSHGGDVSEAGVDWWALGD